MNPALSVAVERWPIAGGFTIARGTKTEAVVVVATVRRGGCVGTGECVPYARYGETVEGVVQALQAQAGAIAAGLGREALLQAMPAGAARNALDGALWCAAARAAGEPVWARAGLPRPQPVVTAFTLSLGTPAAKTAFLFTRVGLAGADMGACGLLPRVIGQGRAAELLFSGRAMTADEGAAWGFFNALHGSDELLAHAQQQARALADGPWFAHTITKTMLNQEWAMGLEEMIESEAQAQALCMLTKDFRRAFEAFAAKQQPRFEGN